MSGEGPRARAARTRVGGGRVGAWMGADASSQHVTFSPPSTPPRPPAAANAEAGARARPGARAQAQADAPALAVERSGTSSRQLGLARQRVLALERRWEAEREREERQREADATRDSAPPRRSWLRQLLGACFRPPRVASSSVRPEPSARARDRPTALQAAPQGEAEHAAVAVAPAVRVAEPMRPEGDEDAMRASGERRAGLPWDAASPAVAAAAAAASVVAAAAANAAAEAAGEAPISRRLQSLWLIDDAIRGWEALQSAQGYAAGGPGVRGQSAADAPREVALRIISLVDTLSRALDEVDEAANMHLEAARELRRVSVNRLPTHKYGAAQTSEDGTAVDSDAKACAASSAAGDQRERTSARAGALPSPLGRECSICLAEFEDGDVLRDLPCGHSMHAGCVDRWLTNVSPTCPVCRAQVLDGEEHEVATGDGPMGRQMLRPRHGRLHSEGGTLAVRTALGQS